MAICGAPIYLPHFVMGHRKIKLYSLIFRLYYFIFLFNNSFCACVIVSNQWQYLNSYTLKISAPAVPQEAVPWFIIWCLKCLGRVTRVPQIFSECLKSVAYVFETWNNCERSTLLLWGSGWLHVKRYTSWSFFFYFLYNNCNNITT